MSKIASRHQRIAAKIKQHYPDCRHLELVDESSQHNVPPGSESHFKLLLVADQFTGKNRLARQRAVLDLMAEELQSGLHALTLRLLTQGEWEKENTQFLSPPCHGKK